MFVFYLSVSRPVQLFHSYPSNSSSHSNWKEKTFIIEDAIVAVLPLIHSHMRSSRCDLNFVFIIFTIREDFWFTLNQFINWGLQLKWFTLLIKSVWQINWRSRLNSMYKSNYRKVICKLTVIRLIESWRILKEELAWLEISSLMVWPNVRRKSSPNFEKVSTKIDTAVFTLKIKIFR